MKALLIIDMQNDFIPGGSLAVADGNKVIPYINQLQNEFSLVVASQDWHPENHISFANNHKGYSPFDSITLDGHTEVLWPAHCVQGTNGAEFHPELNLNKIETIFRKGMNPVLDSYSAFYDNRHQKATGLGGYLEEKEIDTLHMVGLAADYCVYYSIKDALGEGFQVTLHLQGTKAIDNKGFQNKLKELKALKNFKVIN